jgi:hypothetical protein
MERTYLQVGSTCVALVGQGRQEGQRDLAGPQREAGGHLGGVSRHEQAHEAAQVQAQVEVACSRSLPNVMEADRNQARQGAGQEGRRSCPGERRRGRCHGGEHGQQEINHAKGAEGAARQLLLELRLQRRAEELERLGALRQAHESEYEMR